jgi:hypothetical protein
MSSGRKSTLGWTPATRWTKVGMRHASHGRAPGRTGTAPSGSGSRPFHPCVHPELPVTRSPAVIRRTLAALAAVALTATGLTWAGAASAAPGHTTVVDDVPSTSSPDIMNGTVFIHDATGRSSLRKRSRVRITGVDISAAVLAFLQATGTVIPFVPTLAAVWLRRRPPPSTWPASSTPSTLTRRKGGPADVSGGSVVTGFAGPAFAGGVTSPGRHPAAAQRHLPPPAALNPTSPRSRHRRFWLSTCYRADRHHADESAARSVSANKLAIS